MIHDSVQIPPPASPIPSAHPLLYPSRHSSKGRPDAAWPRDATANLELLLGVSELGLGRPGTTILNMPPPSPIDPQRELRWDELLKVELDFVVPGDFLVLTTRPPVHDHDLCNRKRVEPARTKLERMIFQEVERYLALCARSQIMLSRIVRERLPIEFADRANFETYQFGGAGRYRKRIRGRRFVRVPADEPERIPCFLLRTEALWPGGPGLLLAFSMDSTSTLAWCWRLRRDLRHLLEKPGFRFYELLPGERPDRATDLRWVEHWGVERIVEVD
jgi:hypothetical protein